MKYMGWEGDISCLMGEELQKEIVMEHVLELSMEHVQQINGTM